MKIRIDIDIEQLTTQLAVIDGKKLGFYSNEPFIYGSYHSLNKLCEGMREDIDMVVSTIEPKASE